jgi:uncharacterized membrane protein (UPF0136 family)
MQTAGIVTIVYGLFVLAGGLIGFRQAGSRASLLSGGVAGTLALVAGAGLLSGREWGGWLGLVVSAALAVFFLVRYMRTGRVFPALVSLMLSLVDALVILTLARP